MNQNLSVFSVCRFQLLVMFFGFTSLLSGCMGGLMSSTSPTASKSLSDLMSKDKVNTEELPAETTAQLCAKTAQQMESRGHLAEAIGLYERTISTQPKNFSVLHRLGILYARTGDVVRARERFEQALALDSKSPEVQNDFGFLCIQQGELERAESVLKAVVRDHPSNTRAFNNLASVLVKTGKSDEAFQLMERKLGPAAANSNLGVLLAKEGQHDEAKFRFAQAEQKSKDLQQPPAFLAYYKSKAPVND